MGKENREIRDPSPDDVSTSLSSNEGAVDPRLDPFAHGPLLDIIDRFRQRLLEEAARIAGNRTIDANHLERAYQTLFFPESDVDWSTANRRRVDLIRKEISGDISATEQAELAELQARADRRMSETVPRRMKVLQELEARLGISDVDENTSDDSEK